MKPVHIVIGANYGDEGKGLLVDYLSSAMTSMGTRPVVVRHNGGAQAGHTVVTAPEGERHVFKHVGSGALVGASTYLSSFFVCNPILFRKELEELMKLNVIPEVLVSHDSPVTTPYDVMINQLVEQHRGDNRHGSVGVGFGETIERAESLVYALKLQDLLTKPLFLHKLRVIKDQWVPERLAELGVNINQISDEWRHYLQTEKIFTKFVEKIDKFLACVSPVTSNFLCLSDVIMIFEGA